MARFSQFCLILLLCRWYQVHGTYDYSFISASEIIEDSLETARRVDDYWKNVVKHVSVNSNESDLLQLFRRELYDDLIALSINIPNVSDQLISMIPQELMSKVTSVTNEFFKLVEDVQTSYKKFIKCLRNANKASEVTTLLQFINVSTLSSDTNVQRTLERMHEQFFHPNNNSESLLSIIAKNSTTTDIMCMKSKSKQQLVNEIHEVLVNATIKVMLITSFSYNVRSDYEKKSLTSELERARETFNEKINQAYEYLKRALINTSRVIWRCDPSYHRKSVTYDKLEEVFQAYIVSDVDIADAVDRSGNDYAWHHTCYDIKDARVSCTTQNCKTQPKNRMCTGHLRDCLAFTLHYAEVCYSRPANETRYDWVRYTPAGKSMQFLGEDNKDCQQQFFRKRVEREDICMCNCESEDREAERYFSLLDVVSDRNKVVTGVKFTKNLGVFHIQIQQGTLGANGTITDEPKWKDVNLIKRDDLLAPKVSRQQPSWVEFYKNDLVYAVTYSQSYVFLDTLESHPSRLVTGMRFEQVSDNLKLAIQTTPFDYATGKLGRAASSWQSTNNQKRDKRDEVVIKGLRQIPKTDENYYILVKDTITYLANPLKCYGPDVVSTGNKYVQFTMTGFQLDIGSYTVPFLDVQEITTNPPMPLSGAGLIHRAKQDCGGFLGLEIIHYDYSGHL